MRAFESEWDVVTKHGAFLQRVARSLVKDAGRSDDLVQEAWLAFLSKPPRRDEGLRGWLAAVVRNTARGERRSVSRRRRRELEFERRRTSSSDPSAALELREREELLDRVTDAVRSLDEHYRQVVLLRFYEDLKPREIAERLEIPVETVRTRTRRALELIATRLDERTGDRRTWAMALIPFCRGRTGRTSEMLATSGAKVALVAATLAVLSLGVWAVWPRDDALPRDGAGVASAENGPGSIDTLSDASPARSRAPAGGGPSAGAPPAGDPSGGPPADAPPLTPPVAFHVHGAVVDGLTDRPIPDATVRLVRSMGWRDQPRPIAMTRTGARGRFDFPRHSARLDGLGLEVESDGYVPHGAYRGSKVQLDSSDNVIRMFPGAVITGEVIFAHDGTPVEGGIGLLSWNLASSPYASSPQVLPAARFMSEVSALFRIDSSGGFRIATQEDLVAIEVHGPGFAPAFSEPIRPLQGESTHVVIRVYPGKTLSGTVRSPSGEPVAGAVINTWPAVEDRYPDHLYFNHSIRPEAITDASGRFEISNFASHLRSIEVTHPEWPRWAKYDDGWMHPAGEELEIVLVPGARLTGKLRVDGVEPSDAAELARRLGEYPRGEIRIARERIPIAIDAGGAFESEALPAGALEAVLHVDGWLDTGLDWESRSSARSDASDSSLIDVGEVKLDRGRELAVIVRDVETGEPVAAAKVALVRPGSSPRREETIDERETDEKGRARVSGITAGGAIVVVTRNGYVEKREAIEGSGANAQDSDSSALEVRLPRAGSLRGRVVDAFGEPVAGARLSLVPKDPPQRYDVAWSAARGEFRFHDVPPDRAFDLKVSAKGFIDASTAIEPLASGETRLLASEVALSKGGAFSGRVVDADGRGIAGATVAARLVPTGGIERLGRLIDPWTETDASGGFHLTGFAAGDYFISAGYLGRNTNQQVKLEADGVTEVTIEFSELGRGETWSAIVQDPSGAPIDYASVFYHLARTVTDADGRFTCYDLAESGKVTIEHQHYLLREVAWSATSELPEVITLDPGAALEVHIDLRGPKPIPTWINVNLLGARRGQAPGVQVDRSGTAKMYALEPGECTILCWSPDFPLPSSRSVTLRSGNTLALDIELDGTKRPPAIVVTNSAREPVANASITFEWKDPNAPTSDGRVYRLDTVRTDPNGHAQSPLALSGGVSMTIEAEGYGSRHFEECRSLIDPRNEIQAVLGR